MRAPLEDITVVEIDSWMASPSAAAIMADMGARVIKIEPLKGDPMRSSGRPPKIDDEALKAYDFQFDVDNRGKESICVDLTKPEGIELVHKLVEEQPAQKPGDPDLTSQRSSVDLDFMIQCAKARMELYPWPGLPRAITPLASPSLAQLWRHYELRNEQAKDRLSKPPSTKLLFGVRQRITP